MPDLVLGPLLRYVGETEAVIWVETDSPCEVEVLGTRERTFCVDGHHYALVCCGGLRPGTWHEYEVRLDGERVWPVDDGFPAQRLPHLPEGRRRCEVVFGSCRVAAPHEPPYSLRKDEDERGREVDALHTLAQRMRNQPREQWPDVLLMIGDQVYADEVSPGTRSFIEARRDVREPPGERVLDFEEYTQLYRESWGDPTIRWLLSTVSTAMIFDDHDVHDDWNISQAWLEEMRATNWWDRHIVGALASYWVYQHIGNLAARPSRRRRAAARASRRPTTAGRCSSSSPARPTASTSGTRWSYCRDLGRTRLVVIDSRAGRVLEEGRRSMLDESEWEWVGRARSRGDFDHLLVATSLPWLLGPGMHYAEAWSEAVAGGALGRGVRAARRARAPERWTWSTGRRSRSRSPGWPSCCARWARASAGAPRRRWSCCPATCTTPTSPRSPSGAARACESNVYQAVCSPYRNPLEKSERRMIRIGMSRPFEVVMRALARPPRAWTTRTCAGAWSATAPGSTTRWRRW